MALQVATAAINALRDNHYVLNTVSGLNERSVLMEGSRTNSLLNSRDLSNAGWSKTGSSAVRTALGSDGVAASASILTEDTSTGAHLSQAASVTITTGAAQSCYADLKANGRTKGSLFLNGAGGTNRTGVKFDLTLGTITGFDILGAGTNPTYSAITLLSNGYYRIEFVGALNGVDTTGGLAVRMYDATGTITYTGDGVSGFIVDFCGVEVDQPFPSSRIATVGSTVTRGADSYSVPFTTPPQAMTVYSKFVERGTISTSGSSRVLAIGSGNPRLIIISTGAFYQLLQHNGTASVTSTQAVAPAIGNTVELRAILNADGSVQLGQSINGAAEVLATASAANALPAAWSLATLYLNAEAGSSVGFNAFLVPYKVALGVKTLAQMQAL